MKALITGASSGIGRDMARILAKQGVDLILVARRKERLIALKAQLAVDVTIIVMDISIPENCIALYERCKNEEVDILINNAGLGDFGKFETTELEKDMQLIDTNIKALHILTKLFLKDFKKRNKGYILNVASSAAFLPGPLMATYYATKSYAYRLSLSIWKELRKEKSNVSISVLCPGPVKTEFDKVANVTFLMRGKRSEDVALEAIRGMFQRKMVIIPGILMQSSYYLCKSMPLRLQMCCSYHIQNHKNK